MVITGIVGLIDFDQLARNDQGRSGSMNGEMRHRLGVGRLSALAVGSIVTAHANHARTAPHSDGGWGRSKATRRISQTARVPIVKGPMLVRPA